MSADFTEIVVSRTAEQAFRRRAIHAYPNEYIEALWGRIKQDKIYIHAFMPIKHEGKPKELYCDEFYQEDHEDEAVERANLTYLGTIHTHPNLSDCAYSEHDLRDIQDKLDIVMGICSINQKEKSGKKRHNSEMVYWPAPRPMKVLYAP